MEAIVKQKVGRIASTGRKMFDIDVVINDQDMGCLSLHTFWRDMPYPMYRGKITKLQKLTNIMVEKNFELGLMSRVYAHLYYNGLKMDSSLADIRVDSLGEATLIANLIFDFLTNKY